MGAHTVVGARKEVGADKEVEVVKEVGASKERYVTEKFTENCEGAELQKGEDVEVLRLARMKYA